jgi:hypothetical protein
MAGRGCGTASHGAAFSQPDDRGVLGRWYLRTMKLEGWWCGVVVRAGQPRRVLEHGVPIANSVVEARKTCPSLLRRLCMRRCSRPRTPASYLFLWREAFRRRRRQPISPGVHEKTGAFRPVRQGSAPSRTRHLFTATSPHCRAHIGQLFRSASQLKPTRPRKLTWRGVHACVGAFCPVRRGTSAPACTPATAPPVPPFPIVGQSIVRPPAVLPTAHQTKRSEGGRPADDGDDSSDNRAAATTAARPQTAAER